MSRTQLEFSHWTQGVQLQLILPAPVPVVQALGLISLANDVVIRKKFISYYKLGYMCLTGTIRGGDLNREAEEGYFCSHKWSHERKKLVTRLTWTLPAERTPGPESCCLSGWTRNGHTHLKKKTKKKKRKRCLYIDIVLPVLHGRSTHRPRSTLPPSCSVTYPASLVFKRVCLPPGRGVGAERGSKCQREESQWHYPFIVKTKPIFNNICGLLFDVGLLQGTTGYSEQIHWSWWCLYLSHS